MDIVHMNVSSVFVMRRYNMSRNIEHALDIVQDIVLRNRRSYLISRRRMKYDASFRATR